MTIKKELLKKGFTFKSDTDTEVLINLIEYVQQKGNYKLGKALQIALNEVVGAYAIAVFDLAKPNEIVAARLGSPLAIGVGNDEFFIASDASPFIEYTNNAVYLEDEEMAVIRLHKETKYRKIKDDSLFDPYLQELKLNLEEIEKGGYDHFMIKEIFEQPRAILDTYRGRLNVNKGIVKMAGVEDHIDKFLNAQKITIVAYIGPKENKLGIRGSDTHTLQFNNVKVPKENRIGEDGFGFKFAMKTLSRVGY